MDIRVFVDFNILGNYLENKNQFNENIDTLKKIISLHSTYLFISSSDAELINSFNISEKNIIICLEEDILDKNKFIGKISDDCDWVLYFKHGTKSVVRDNNIIYSPIELKGEVSVFKDISFTEHAKNKKYYHDFSNYYMFTLANDTQKEVDFLCNVFKKYLNKDFGKALDCCCGVGRHSFLLANKGFKVKGIDISQDQIDNAKKLHSHCNVDYEVMDVRDFNLNDKDYDMSYCMWTTYNYLSLDNDLKKFIVGNYNHQSRGGILVLDSKNIPKLDYHRMYNRYVDKDNFKMEILINKYVFDNIQNSQYFLFINDNGMDKFFFDDEFVRFYTLEELKNIVLGYYEIVYVYGDFDMNKYDERNSNRFIVVLKRI